MSISNAVVRDNGTAPSGSVTGPRMHSMAVSTAVSVRERVDIWFFLSRHDSSIVAFPGRGCQRAAQKKRPRRDA